MSRIQSANWAPRNWPVELGRRGFRLPTESEWEVASRAGARTAYGYGSEVSLLGRFGWFMENSGKHVHPPRELRPSVRGLFDLHGNLFEWTHDWYGDFGSEAVTDPLGAKGGSARVLRGGGWGDDAANCRAAFRSTDASDVPLDQQRLPAGPESVWSHAGGGAGQVSGAIGRRHGGSAAEPRPECRSRMAERRGFSSGRSLGFRVASVPSASPASPASGAGSGSR